MELGGFYLDVIKDRLYCDAADSKRRASAQSTLYDIAHALVRMIAPILPFTAEECWEFLPGAENESIHLQTFMNIVDVRVDGQAWNHFFTLREQVNAALDQAKKDKIIGSSIAAHITIPNLDRDFADTLGETWEQLFIVAGVSDGSNLSVATAEGMKCPRCWNVGRPAYPKHKSHEELCSRCFEVIVGCYDDG